MLKIKMAFVLILSLITINSAFSTIVEDILQVPMTTVAPEIDGVKDAVWYAVTAEPLLVWVDDIEPDEDWIDLYAVYYLMYDSEQLYFYCDVMDNSIETDSPNAWENDSIELYFDCANLKNDTYVPENDYQWRYVYEDTIIAPGPCFLCDEWAWAKTDYGYALELMIPQSMLPALYFEAGIEFGFEVQVNDRDGAAIQNIAKWWSNSYDSWLNPSLHGTAIFNGCLVGDPMIVSYASGTPVIDGKLNEYEEYMYEASANQYVDDPDLFEMSGWPDLQMNFRMAYESGDSNYIWIYCDVLDDTISTSSPNAWENDGIELYMDALNLKNGAYTPGNDVHWCWVYGDTVGHPGSGNEKVAWAEKENGYAFELMIPAADLPMENGFGPEIGFEIQVNDNDNGELQNSVQWWAGSSDVKTDPSLFGNLSFWHCYECWEWNPDYYNNVEQFVSNIQSFQLLPNHPNPFNPTTKISYTLPGKSRVSLLIFDVTGREILTLVEQEQQAGSYNVFWNARDRFGQAVGSGIYFYQLRAGDYIETRKMVLVR